MNAAPDLAVTTCADVEPFLPIIADGGLDPNVDVEIFAHIARCQECQAALARHDLVTLAIGNGAKLAPQKPRLELVHYRVPLPWAIASAAALACALGGGWWLHRAQPAAPQTPVLAQNSLQKNASEIIRVHKPGQPNQRPYYVVVQDGNVTVIDPQSLDGGATAQPAKYESAAPLPRY